MALSILALIIIWLLLGLIFSDSNKDSSDETENTLSMSSMSESNAYLPEVLVELIEAESFQREISLLGETRFSRRVMISALTEGRVIYISDKKGQQLNKNTIVIKIDNREAQAQFNHANSLEKQRRMELDGYEKLFDEELISPSRLAEARSEFENAKAKKIQQQIKLESTQVSLPFSGILQKILVAEGDYVRLGQDLIEVLDFSPFIILGAVAEKDAIFIEQNKNASATLINGEVYEGIIAYKSKQADESSRSFQVELEIPNHDNSPILSGISSTINIPVIHKHAHKLSASVLEIGTDGKFGVKLINDNNVVSFNPIEIIKSSNLGVWATGLPKVAKVIIRGQGFVNAGDEVKAVYKTHESSAQKSFETENTSSSVLPKKTP